MEKNNLTLPTKEIKLGNNIHNYQEIEIKEYKSSLRENITASLSILARYAKARWLIFNFPWATFVALMIAYNGAVDIPIAVLAVSSSYLILLATYTYNDAQDLEVDRINDPNRPLVSGRATKDHIIRLTYMLNATALIMAGLINLYVFAIASILVVLGVLYSHPKTSFKDKFPYKTLVTSFGAMLASFLGGFVTDDISINAIYAGIAFFAFCTMLALLGDISDIKGDKANGRRTLPIIIGQRNTALVIHAALISMILITIWFYSINYMSVITMGLAVTVCVISIIKLLSLFKISDVKKIKKLRPPMRILSFAFQLVLLIGLFI
ncbi:MAG: geranylgeranylglycerol-phosphate geranylgeranyltransferase [Candidatus Nitrosocaldaceae archaeon]|nr:MAG: geranylgeranylglycerol-phosphate geranylgeranyltransferase [Candidatus Nitrosocaldaceae archaeon]